MEPLIPIQSTMSIVLFLFSALGLAAALDETPPAAEKILSEFEAKTGGGPIGSKSLRVTGTVSVAGMPGGGTFEETFVGADRVKILVEWPGMGSMTQGRAGDRAWSTDPALGITVKEGAEAAPVRAQYGLFRLDPWKAHYAKAETVGKADVGGRPHFEIRLAPAAGGSATGATWFIDCETKLLSRADLVLPDPMGGELPMQWLFSGWKKQGDRLYPAAKTQVAGGMRIEYAIASVEVDAAISPDAAAPAPDVVAAMNDPSRRTPQAPTTGGDCRVETIAEQPIASIRMTIPAAEVSRHLAIMLPEVMQYVSKSGAEVAGPPFSRYHALSADTIDIEAGIPVKRPVAGEGRVKGASLPGGKAATTWHVGPYHELPKSYEALRAYLAKESLAERGPFWEVYWTDPGIERDPQKWRTQIFWPVNP